MSSRVLHGSYLRAENARERSSASEWNRIFIWRFFYGAKYSLRPESDLLTRWFLFNTIYSQMKWQYILYAIFLHKVWLAKPGRAAESAGTTFELGTPPSDVECPIPILHITITQSRQYLACAWLRNLLVKCIVLRVQSGNGGKTRPHGVGLGTRSVLCSVWLPWRSSSPHPHPPSPTELAITNVWLGTLIGRGYLGGKILGHLHTVAITKRRNSTRNPG